MNNALLNVFNVPCAADQWKSMGTEYSRSIFAIKELIENSLSASGANQTDLLIKVISLNSDELLFSIEDNSGGTDDVNLLLTISSDSKKKKGLYSVFGHGLKHSLAYFQKDYQKTDWIIQSRTESLLENSEMIEIQAPYLFPSEYNEKFEHNGIHAVKISHETYKGEFKVPGTYIEFSTGIDKFSRLNPFKTGGRPQLLVESIVTELSNMISLIYLPLLRDKMLNVTIKYGSSDETLKIVYVKNIEFPIKSTIGKHRPNEIIKLKSGGIQKMNIKYVQIDRSQKHPFVIAQANGLLCYVNGVLMEGFTWINEIFGDVENHPSMNSCLCLVEINATKENSPELSVSKTKFIPDGENYKQMLEHILNVCPKQELSAFRKQNNTASELTMRDRRYDMIKDVFGPHLSFINTEAECVLPNGDKAGDNMAYDLIYANKHDHILTIEEFKKESVKPQDVAQIIQYAKIAEVQYPNYQLKLVLASQRITNTAKDLIDFYVSRNFNLEFKSFVEMHIPGALVD
jgi:hypothetical protein